MHIDKQLIRQAKKIVSFHRNYSISFLQRTLGIGYNRASILMEHIQQSTQKRKRSSVRLSSKNKKKFRYAR